MSRRVERINGLLRQEISQLLAREIKDPRLGGVISITQVQTASDLRSARVLVSVMGDRETRETALDGIQSAAAFLRRELRDRLKLRYVPFLKFALDDSMENADALLRLMDRLRAEPVDPDPSPAARYRPLPQPARICSLQRPPILSARRLVSYAPQPQKRRPVAERLSEFLQAGRDDFDGILAAGKAHRRPRPESRPLRYDGSLGPGRLAGLLRPSHPTDGLIGGRGETLPNGNAPWRGKYHL